MKKKIWGIIAGLLCCACLVGAIVFLSKEPDSEQVETSEPEGSSSQSFHSNNMLASRQDITSVRITSADGSFTVVAGQSGAQPHIKELEGVKQDHQLENALLTLCSSVKGQKLVEQDAKDLKKYGLDKPSGEAEITYSDGSKADIVVGDIAPSDERQVYAAVKGQSSVWLVENSASVYFTGKVRDYVSKVVSPMTEKTTSQTADMTITRQDGQNITLKRNGDVWTMTSPITAALDSERSAGTVGGLYGLNAEYCEAVHPDDAAKAKCGLDKPKAEVTLKEGSFDLELKIGSAVVRSDESEKERYYCYLDGGADTDCIYVIAKEYLPWLDTNAAGLISEMIFPNYLVNLRKIEITAGGKKTEYLITNEGGDNTKINEDVSKMRTASVTSGGKELDLVQFREFYAFLMKCPTEKIFTDNVSGDASVVIVYTKNDGSQDKLELVKTGSGYGTRVNGQMCYLADSSWVETLIVDIDALAQGRKLTAQS